MSRFSRFLHLERDREAAPNAKADSERARAARFDAVQVDAAEREAQGSAEGHLARFDQAKERELELDDKRSVDQPFVRCAQCHGDNAKFARECQHCHVSLDTPEQRGFNEEEWTRIRAIREQEQADHAAFKEGQARHDQEHAALQRKMFEEMARESRRSTLAGLDGSDSWTRSRWGFGRRHRPWTVERAVWSAAIFGALITGSAIGGRTGMVIAAAVAISAYVGWSLLRRNRH